MTEPLLVDRSDSYSEEVLTFSGPLTASNGAVFENAMRREEPADLVILDLSEVPYVDSAGLGLLVSAYVSRQKAGRSVALSGVNERVFRLFEITKTESLFLMFETIDDAIAALSGAAQA